MWFLCVYCVPLIFVAKRLCGCRTTVGLLLVAAAQAAAARHQRMAIFGEKQSPHKRVTALSGRSWPTPNLPRSPNTHPSSMQTLVRTGFARIRRFKPVVSFNVGLRLLYPASIRIAGTHRCISCTGLEAAYMHECAPKYNRMHGMQFKPTG